MVRILGEADRVIGQDELTEPLIVEGAGRPDRSVVESGRLRIRVAVKRGLIVAAIAGPKAATADLMRVRLAHHPRTEIRRLAVQIGRGTAGETGDRQIEATPEEMHRADLADEART